MEELPTANSYTSTSLIDDNDESAKRFDIVAHIRSLQEDMWFLLDAASSRGTGLSMLSLDRHPERLACLRAEPEEILFEPSRFTDFIVFTEALAAQMAPATPDTIRFCTAYSNPNKMFGRFKNTFIAHARRVRRIFVFLTFLTVLLALIAMAATSYLIVGAGRADELAAASSVLEGQSALLASPPTGSSQDAAENRAVAANENMERWNSIFSTEPRLLQSRSQLLSTIEKSRSEWALRFQVLATIILPVVLSLLGAYSNFVRWFVQQIEAQVLQPRIGTLIVNRFVLALIAGLLFGAAAQNLGRHAFDQVWAVLIFCSFIGGYSVNRLFGWLDSLVCGLFAAALIRKMERSTRDVVSQSVSEIFATHPATNYSGRIGLDVMGPSGSVWSSPSLEKATVRATSTPVLRPSVKYVLVVRVGRDIGELPIVDSLAVSGGKEAPLATFDLEVECSQLRIQPRSTTVMVSTTGSKWVEEKFSVTLLDSAKEKGISTDLWVTARQRGLTFQVLTATFDVGHAD